MKKNDYDMLDLVNKIQAQLIAVEMKIDTLMSRSMGGSKPAPRPAVYNTNFAARPNDHHKDRPIYKAICADCQKECTIPFKPTADRPVYCQDCFSRRKVMRLSGMKIEQKPQMTVQKPPFKAKKKSFTAKKAPAKKKLSPKKK